jgi:hypothetical protein
VTSHALCHSDRAYPASVGRPPVPEVCCPLPAAPHQIVPKKSYSKRGNPCSSTTGRTAPMALCRRSATFLSPAPRNGNGDSSVS